jgi:hypothetical protein
VADLAALSTEDLHQRQRLHSASPDGLPTVIRVAVVHPTLGPVLAGEIADTGCRLDVVAASTDATTLHTREPVDVLVVDLAALGPDPGALLGEMITRLSPKSTLVLYHFVSRPLRRSLQRRALRLVPAQLPLELLRQQSLDALLAEGLQPRAPEHAGLRVPRFSRTVLEHLSNRPADLLCECPNHLARLSLALREFEAYSRGCASLSRADAELHRDVADGTAAACGLIEDLLARVCQYEGIPGEAAGAEAP